MEQALKDKPAEEFVRDYPLPPKIEDISNHIKIIFNGIVVAETYKGRRVLEKGHAPAYYIPPGDVKNDYLAPAENPSFCPWKGEARYYHLTVNGKTARYACWYYPDPKKEFESIKNYIAFYPGKMDTCYIDEEKASPEPAKYYGGWITTNIKGPFDKGKEH
jgi:uncharacterized protein (DUF427 family)